jgi:tRNA A37 methylthiotransferase MiaB
MMFRTVKQERANEIMELQSQISWDLNQEKIGKSLNVSSIAKKEATL